jgi:uncharacterized protein YjbI with pentapeptide repeats
VYVLKRWAATLRRVPRVWVLRAAAALVAGLVIVWTLLVPAADWLATHNLSQATKALQALRLQAARDAAQGRLLTLGAGLLAAGALWFAARKFTLPREEQVTDRYTKAIDQLGSDKLDVRIGGIYALERVARDSLRDHPTVMEVLAAFIREHSREQGPSAESGAELPQWTTRPDVQAAVTAIGRRNSEYDRQSVNLSGSQLLGADLTGADLTSADLTSADLTGADLTGADLTAVHLTSARLTGADLTAAHLTRADLTGADLSGAHLSGTVLRGADLTGAHLTDADLTSAHLFGADLSGAHLTRAHLTRAHLTGAHLYRANLSNASLIGADLYGADLTDADLTRAYLTGADLTGADLTRADFTRAGLTGAAYPDNHPVLEGWVRDPRSGRLSRTSEHTGDAGD